MSDIRPYYSTRQVLDLQEFLAKSDDSYLMCISGSMVYALRVMAKTRLMWPTSWAKERYEQSYLLPDASDFDQIDNIVSQFIHDTEGIEMCNQLLLSKLTDIADAIRLSACCGATGPGTIEFGESVYYGNSDPLSEPTVFGEGEEFLTEQDYLDHKCAAANAIVDGLIQSLNNFALLSLASITAAAILLAIASPVISPIPLAVFIAIGLTGFAFGGFHTLANAIDDNRQELVCLLYSVDTAVEGYDALHDFINELEIDLGWLAIEIAAIDAMIEQMTPIDTFNALYSAVGLPEVGEAVSCDTCEEECEWEVVYGSGTLRTDGVQFTITSALNGSGYHEVQISQTVECCPTNSTVQLHSYTSTPNNGFGVYQWGPGDCPAYTRIVNNPTPVIGQWSAYRLSQVETSATPFTLTLSITLP